MDLFLGSKSEIGVEIKISERGEMPLLGYARVWLGGCFLGTMTDLIYLESYLLGGLYQLINVAEMSDPEFPELKEDRYEWFLAKGNDMSDESSDGFLFNFGTLLDNFESWAFMQNGSITIVWKIDKGQNHSIPEDLIDYPTEVFSYSIRRNVLDNFVKRLDRLLKNW